jgi:ribosomal protein S18 acetylase RimI-like enzyme
MRRDFRLRAAHRDDSVSIAGLFRRSFHAALPHIPTLHTPEEDELFFGNALSSGRVEVAFDAATSRLLGFIAFDAGWVTQLYVDPGLLRSGIGSALLDVAKASNSRLQLWAFQANTNARSFYRSQGFREVELTNGSGNEEQEPDVLLEWLAT